MKSLLITLTLFLSTTAFSWVDNEQDFNDYPHYEEIVEKLCLNCGPNENSYEILSIGVSYETEKVTCYSVDLIQTWDDDWGPINEQFQQEVCIDL